MVKWLLPLLLLLPVAEAWALPDTFMEVSVTPRDPYVQQSVEYRLRLYRDPSLTQGAFVDPADPAAVWLLAEEREPVWVEREGRDYRMSERRYRLLPQRSGEITLGGPVFSGPSDHARAPAVTMKVKPRPADWGEAPWLPARRLSIRERWENPPAPWRVGDQLVRILTLEAVGLSGAQLPPFPLPELEGFEARRERVVSEQRFEEGRLVGRRSERWILTARRAGTWLLPTNYVKWWSLEEGRERVASLGGAELSFEPAFDAQLPRVEATVAKGAVASPEAWSWWWLSALPLLALLHPLMRWAARRLIHHLSVNGARRALADACRRNDAKGAAKALRCWARLHDGGNRSLAELARRLDDPAAEAALRALDAALYAPAGEPWDGAACARGLLPALRRWKSRRTAPGRSRLPPL